MVSGRYFLPTAPLLCLKRMPAWAVTSVNSTGPDGRGGVGLGEGDTTAAAVSVAGAVGATVAGFLQPAKIVIKKKTTNEKCNIFARSIQYRFLSRNSVAATPARSRSASLLDQR